MTRAALAIVFTLGCVVRQQAGPVPVHGAAAEVDELVGRWEGSYWVPGQARRGTLRFDLAPGADTAHGEIEMTFARSLRLYGDETASELPRRPCTVIDIAVVRLDSRKVGGSLAPYWDPDCDCRAITVFEGELARGRIEGTFSSRREGGDSVALRGAWFAERRPSQ